VRALPLVASQSQAQFPNCPAGLILKRSRIARLVEATMLRIRLAAMVPEQFIFPQFGIVAQGTHAHYFLEFDFKRGVTLPETVTAFRRLRTPDVSAGGVNLVMAFGESAWRAVAPMLTPADLGRFQAVVGTDGRSAPATQHDAWLWISGAEPDVVWQSARAAAIAVSEAADLATEQPGFTYLGGRDITGFIDGTANPQVRRAADVAVVPPGHSGEGGSHVLVMRWVHDLTAFERLSVEEQQQVIGRTKSDSVELSKEEKPPNAHISRVEVSAGGHELEIFRRSVPYGSTREHGLYFVAFSAECLRFEVMLARMFGNAEDGLRDRLTDFSHPVSGAYYSRPHKTPCAKSAGQTPTESAPSASRRMWHARSSTSEPRPPLPLPQFPTPLKLSPRLRGSRVPATVR
jgi:porphyrinogen peroxidase